MAERRKMDKLAKPADDIPLPGEIGELKDALEVRRQLMDMGQLIKAREFMREWYRLHRDEE